MITVSYNWQSCVEGVQTAMEREDYEQVLVAQQRNC